MKYVVVRTVVRQCQYFVDAPSDQHALGVAEARGEGKADIKALLSDTWKVHPLRPLVAWRPRASANKARRVKRSRFGRHPIRDVELRGLRRESEGGST